MEISKQFLKDKGIHPNVEFADNQWHTLEILNEKHVQEKAFASDQMVDKVKYLYKENNELKAQTTESVGLIRFMSQRSVGDTVKIRLVLKGAKKIYEGELVKAATAPASLNTDMPNVTNTPSIENPQAAGDAAFTANNALQQLPN